MRPLAAAVQGAGIASVLSPCGILREQSWATRHHHFRQVETALHWAVEEQLPGWACRTRTGESVRELSDWICVTTSPQVARAGRRRPLRVQATSNGFAAPAKISAGNLSSATHSRAPISRRSCCRRRPRRRRSSALPMPAATPSTRSSRHRNSASSRAARSLLAC
jgi:hypothetical protein